MSPLYPRVVALNPGGHDFMAPNFDGLGIFYVSLSIAYTFAVLAGLFWLWGYRNHQVVRLRGITLPIVTCTFLHVYVILVLLVYPQNGSFSCTAEFWVMSLLLPFAIGLFQACNVEALSVSERQFRLARSEILGVRKSRFRCSAQGLWTCFKELNSAQKTYVGIGFGFLSTVLTTLFLYFGSRRFHPSYGFFGEEVGPGECRRGAEWVPSIFWQLLWSCVFGPYLYFKLRHMQDDYWWAGQTRIAIICSCFGTPLWLVFTYVDSPGIHDVITYFPAAMWFIPGLVAMQTLLWLTPIVQAKKYDVKVKRWLELPRDAIPSRPSSSASSVDSMSYAYFNHCFSMFSRDGMKHLQYYAARTSMNAEIVTFLMQVRQFQSKYSQLKLYGPSLGEAYRDAALIFFCLINEATSEFPINLPFHISKELSAIFSNVHYSPLKEDTKSNNVITPWDDFGADEVPMSPTAPEKDVLEGKVEATDGQMIHVPADFSGAVFDKAFEHAKQDLYNSRTFQRFYEEWVDENKSTDNLIYTRRASTGDTKDSSYKSAITRVFSM